MRNPIVLAMLAVVLLAAGTAQAGLVPQFGVKGGLNLANVDLDDLDSSSRTGWAAGFYCDFANPIVHLQPEVLYTSKGFEGGEVTIANHELDYRSTWLEIPVLVVFSLPTPAFSPRAFIGPAVSIPLASEIRFDDRGWHDIDDGTQTTWSLILGVGATLGRFGLEARYDFGLTEINEQPLGDLVDSLGDDLHGEDLKDRTISVLASFGFN